MIYILDTNVLLDSPQIVEDDSKTLVISTAVLQELDALKKHLNPEVSQKARKAAVYIAKNYDNIRWDDHPREGSVDTQLLEITKEMDGTLITNDIYLKVRAKIQGIKTKGHTFKDDYTGVEYWLIELDENGYNEELEEAMETGKVPEGFALFENQYLIVKDKNSPIEKDDFETVVIFRFKQGKLERVVAKEIKNQWVKKIFPRNPEQICLFNALLDSDSTILYAGGKWGRGKSFIINNFALQELEKGRIKKIVYVPNNAFTENTIDLGAMPG